MKILHVLYSGLGGHGNIFFSFVKNGANDGLQYEALFNGIEAVKPESLERCATFNVDWHFVAKKKGLDIGYYRKLMKWIRKSDADIVFLHSAAYILPAKLGSLFSKRKKRIIVRETQANQLKSKMEWFWLAVAMLAATNIVFLSEEYRIEISKKLRCCYRSKKIKVIPNGIDLDLFKPEKKYPGEKKIFGMQSRLVPIKDHLTLLEAFSIIRSADKNYLLKIAGDGEYRQVLVDRAAALGLGGAVEFTGIITEDDLPEFLCSLDIYVHASLGETMSTAIMQAMACGLPVIASDVMGINNMIEDENTGILVPSKDATALARAMGSLMADEPKRTALSLAARQYAENKFSNKRMLDAYRQLF